MLFLIKCLQCTSAGLSDFSMYLLLPFRFFSHTERQSLDDGIH